MKRAFPFLLIFLAGCIVQSFYPFYTEKSKVALPQLNGEWDAITLWGENVASSVPPWQISDNQIVAYDKDSEPAKIDVTFFKLDKILFCDSIASNNGSDKKMPWYWAWHARPVHTVTKVEILGNVVTLRPLDLDWLTNRIAARKISLLRLSRAEDDHWPLFTASSNDWEQFLKKYANNTDAFPTNHVYVLKRHATTPAK